MSKAQAHLKMLPTDRRRSGRADKRADSVSIQIGEKSFDNVDLIESEWGCLTVRFKEPDELLLSVGQAFAIAVKKDESLVANGNWRIRSIRKDTHFIILCFENIDGAPLAGLKGFIGPEIVLRTNRFRVFDLDAPEGQAKYGEHITEVRTCPLKVPVTIHFENGGKFESSETEFDFSAGSRVLSGIDFKAEKNGSSISVGQPVVLEYSFLAIRYVFQAHVVNVDSDFQIVSVELPRHVVAITARRFDRISCSFDSVVEKKNSNIALDAHFVEVSASGGAVILRGELADGALRPGDEIGVTTSSPKLTFRARAVFLNKSKLGFSFIVDNESDRSVLRLLMNATFESKLVVRSKNNHDRFFRLYQEVGYAPRETSAFNAWAELTEKSWRIQDELLPGNYVGAEGEDGLVTCTGTLPMSPSVVYGHSWAMTKSAVSAGRALELLTQSHAWIELLEGITHLSWCVRKGSRFMGRLHFACESHASPDEQALFHSLALLPGKEIQGANQKFEFRDESELGGYEIGPRFRELIERVGAPHPLLSQWHKVRFKSVFSPGRDKPLAVLICHDSPKNFTAIDVYKTIWCLVLDENSDVSSLCESIRGRSEFRDNEIDLFFGDGIKAPDHLYHGGIETVPILWYFLPKDDFAPILASMCRTIYSVMHKYGDEALPYLQDLVG